MFFNIDYELDERWWFVMKQIVKIIRKVDIEKQYEQVLRLELDYELASLYDAMNSSDEIQKAKSKKRLAEIQKELEGMRAYA